MSLKNTIFTGCVRGFENSVRLLDGRFCWKLMPRFVDMLASDDVLLDIGANVGVYTLYAPADENPGFS